MELEVMVAAVNATKKNLNKMNISCSCVVCNQCGKNGYQEYKNFKIYSYDEVGAAINRNRGLDNISKDIILLCDEDFIYNKDFERIVIDEFKKNNDADLIIFNIDSPYRYVKQHKKNQRLHLYNSLAYGSCNIAFKRESAINAGIRFNTMFGPKSLYASGGGDDTLFVVDFLKNKLKVYSSTKKIGTVYHEKSSWFGNGYSDDYFFAKGALFTAINLRFRHFLMLQYLIRHREVLKNRRFINSYRLMLDGSKDYISRIL